jgi:oligopeptide transport system permease protein
MSTRGGTTHRGRARPLLIPAAILGGLGIIALLAPLLPLADPREIHLEEALSPPLAGAFWETGSEGKAPLPALRRSLFGSGRIGALLGRDELGRCLLARLVHGARVSLAVALTASLVALLLGTVYGSTAGLLGGGTDRALMRVVDAVTALPLVFLVIFVVALLRGYRNAHPGSGLDQEAVLLLVIAAVSWLPIARFVRAEVASLRSRPFIEAAILAGLRRVSVVRTHLLPNLAPLLTVALTLNVPRIFLLEAFLSFLGLGVEAPSVSWGTLARQGYDALTAVHASWWMVVFPALAFATALVAMQALGDALRDRQDPRLATRRERVP